MSIFKVLQGKYDIAISCEKIFSVVLDLAVFITQDDEVRAKCAAGIALVLRLY
jgi:hypothetical protein